MDFKKYKQYINDFIEGVNSLDAQANKIGSFTYGLKEIDLYATGLGEGKRKILITAGVHGEEQAGPIGLLMFLRQDLKKYLSEFTFTIIPVVNPLGFEKKRRRGSNNRDLNRHFHIQSFPENKIIINFLKHKTFDHHIDMHEDSGEKTVYMYETGNGYDNDSILMKSYQFLDWVKTQGVEVNTKERIYGVPNCGGVIHLGSNIRKNSKLRKMGALVPVLIFNGISLRGTTLETPGKIDFDTRVGIQREHLNFWLARN